MDHAVTVQSEGDSLELPLTLFYRTLRLQRRLTMRIRMDRKTFGRNALILAFLVSFSLSAFGQAFPSKHINVYVGFGAGATTDLTASNAAPRSKRTPSPVAVMAGRPNRWA